ncbi:MAG: Ig-like domain-containing protein [Candidatus Marinimicrobia bacterium]|nr:Ig-like domain-containing protein [Candidatus Neomarinimicrobiota bacterium]
MIKKFFAITSLVLLMTIFHTNCEDTTTGLKDVPVEGIAFSDYEYSLEIGETVKLSPIISPENATNKKVYWSSSAGGVATVSSDGLITTVSDGFTIITARTEDGDFEAHCNITVTPDEVNVNGISLDITQHTLNINETVQLTATIYPENATDQEIAWSTSDATIVTVSATGLVTGVSAGTAVITATTNDGGITADCVITVFGVGKLTEIMTKGFLTSPGQGAGVDLAVGPMGNLYMVYIAEDASLDSKAGVDVWAYTGSWTQFGGRVAITDDEAHSPGIAVDVNGGVFVSHLYYDDINDSRYDAICVASSTGGSWTYLGTGNGSPIKDGSNKLNQGSELAFKDDGTLMVASIYYGAGRVYYFDGANWQSYNGYKTNNNSSFWSGGIEVKCYGNIPYISIRTSSGTGKTGVLVGNETNGVYGQWEWLGNSYANSSNQDCSFQDEKTSEASLEIDSEGNIYIAYKALFNGSWYVFIKKFDGTNWSTIGSWEIDNENQVDAVVSNDIVYLIIAKYEGGIEIYSLTEVGSWTKEVESEPVDIYYNFDAVAGVNGEVFIGYECTYNYKGQVGVYQFTPYKP